MIDPSLAPLLDVAAAGSPVADYERTLFDTLEARIGFDVGFCIRPDGIGEHTRGFEPAVRRRIEGQLARYATEQALLKRVAHQRGGVVVDREVLGPAQLMRTRTYREIMLPHQGRCTLLTYVGPMSAPTSLLVLGRTGSDFSAAVQACMSQARSLLQVCERALQGATAAARTPRLTARERELLAYLRLGYSNPQIASACGTSFRTVRNQLTQLFGKLEVATRAEAVARSYQLMLALA